MRVTDEFGAVRPFANDPVTLTLEGPGTLIGENPISLVGGTCAVWVRAGEKPGSLRLAARHPRLGSQTIEFSLVSAPDEEL
jgi:beta-galactosidase